MLKYRREITIVVLFILLSVVLHFLHYAIFHDIHHLLIYGLGDLAFLPLEVLIVTVILHRLLEWRDKKALSSKKNILIGCFFSELGVIILRYVSQMDKQKSQVKDKLTITNQPRKKEFKQALKFLESYKPDLAVGNNEIKLLKTIILPKRGFLSDLIQHPVLIEHKSFTDLLLATFHLAEELSYRKDSDVFSDKDLDHLKIDIARVYERLLPEWIEYISNLKNNYPYLFSLYLRLNPFVKEVNVTVS
ncbi:MAG: hypothetical protein V1739_01170 [Candidatus Omnitrophota bacterium]